MKRTKGAGLQKDYVFRKPTAVYCAVEFAGMLEDYLKSREIPINNDGETIFAIRKVDFDKYAGGKGRTRAFRKHLRKYGYSIKLIGDIAEITKHS